MGVPWNINAVGRLSHTSDQISVASNYLYDVLGRVVRKQDCCGPNPPNNFASHDLAGNMLGLHFPDGRQVASTYDSAGRLSRSSVRATARARPIPHLSAISRMGQRVP